MSAVPSNLPAANDPSDIDPLETQEWLDALDAVLDRLPNLRLDPDAADVHVTGLTFRAPVTLPVLFGS